LSRPHSRICKHLTAGLSTAKDNAEHQTPSPAATPAATEPIPPAHQSAAATHPAAAPAAAPNRSMGEPRLRSPHQSGSPHQAFLEAAGRCKRRISGWVRGDRAAIARNQMWICAWMLRP
jgi:hypothetical protein